MTNVLMGGKNEVVPIKRQVGEVDETQNTGL